MLNSQCHIPRHFKQLFQGFAWPQLLSCAKHFLLQQQHQQQQQLLAPWQARQAAAGPGLPALLGCDAAAMLMQADTAMDTPPVLLHTLHTGLCFSTRGCNNPLEGIFSAGAIKMRSLPGHHNLLPESQP